MDKVKTKILKIIMWQHLLLLLVLITVFVLHIVITINTEQTIFDEKYYVSDARSILAGEGTHNLEHPPLSKLFIVQGMRIFGDTPLGWRFFPIFFGTASVALLYFICRKLNMPKQAVLSATFLFAFENLNFIQSGLAMLDVFCLTFMLAAILLFLNNKLFLSGLFVALSVLCKMPGVFVLGIFFLYWLSTDRKRWQLFVFPSITAAIAFPILITLVEYPLFGQITNPLLRMEQMFFKATTLTFDNSNMGLATHAWEWLAGKGFLFYSFDPQYIAIISPTISLFILPALGYLIFRVIKYYKPALFITFWFICTYLPWVLINVIFERMTYYFYIYPIIGAICMILGLGMYEIGEVLKRRCSSFSNILVYGFLITHIIFFIALSPLTKPIMFWVRI